MTLWLSLGTWSGLRADPKYPPSCDPKDSTNCVQPLVEGETAPFTGQLLSTRRAAKLIVRAEQCDQRLQLKLHETVELWQIKLKLAQDTAAIELESLKKQLQILERALKEAGKVPWYQHPAFVSSMTATILVAILIGSIKVYQALEKN